MQIFLKFEVEMYSSVDWHQPAVLVGFHSFPKVIGICAGFYTYKNDLRCDSKSAFLCHLSVIPFFWASAVLVFFDV